eukprot:m.181840 g.181840  ORF g.181840 m.181840 type:complete len:101 (+) comp18047_c1_seq2:1222-1524(+)
MRRLCWVTIRLNNRLRVVCSVRDVHALVPDVSVAVCGTMSLLTLQPTVGLDVAVGCAEDPAQFAPTTPPQTNSRWKAFATPPSQSHRAGPLASQRRTFYV